MAQNTSVHDFKMLSCVHASHTVKILLIGQFCIVPLCQVLASIHHKHSLYYGALCQPRTGHLYGSSLLQAAVKPRMTLVSDKVALK